MVQDVEHLRPELQFERFVKRKFAVNGKIYLRDSERAQRVASEIPLSDRVSVRIRGRIAERSYARRTIGAPARYCSRRIVMALPPGYSDPYRYKGMPGVTSGLISEKKPSVSS